MEACWMCENYHVDPLHNDRGWCQKATDAHPNSKSLAELVKVKAFGDICDAFAISDSARKVTAEWAAEAAWMRANKHAVDPVNVGEFNRAAVGV